MTTDSSTKPSGVPTLDRASSGTSAQGRGLTASLFIMADWHRQRPKHRGKIREGQFPSFLNKPPGSSIADCRKKERPHKAGVRDLNDVSSGPAG